MTGIPPTLVFTEDVELVDVIELVLAMIVEELLKIVETDELWLGDELRSGTT
jgi:hypothetical protein